MELRRLLYRSEVAIAGSSDAVDRQVAEIVERAASANRAAGITGALMLSADIFIQALEGPPSAVEDTFERICRDLRHRRVRLLEIAAANERVFDEWSMTRVRPVAEVSRLCVGLDGMASSRLDVSAANAIVKSMRAMLVTGALGAKDADPSVRNARTKT